MLRFVPLLFVGLLGCATAALDGADATDTAAPSRVTETCKVEGEACTDYGDGTSDCCITRHTCFPEGCFYTLP